MNAREMTRAIEPIWIFDPVLIGMLITTGVIFALMGWVLRDRIEGSKPLTRFQIYMFYGALVISFLTEASPLHDIAERYLFSAHMVQHLLLSYVVAPMFLASIPAWMIRVVLKPKPIAAVFRVVTTPLVAFFLFSIGMQIWHLPWIYEAALRDPFMHHSQHVVFLILSLIAWWPIMSPMKEFPRMGRPGQLIYLMALPIGQYVASALLTFTQVSIYEMYAQAPRLYGLSVYDDQVIGGIIMKLGSFITFGIPLIVIFFRWYTETNGPLYRGGAAKAKAAVPAGADAPTGAAGSVPAAGSAAQTNAATQGSGGSD